MKIALISQPFDAFIPPSMNSIGIWIYEMSRGLAKDHDVLVYGRRGLARRQEIGKPVRTQYVYGIPQRWLSRLSYRVSPHYPAKRPFFSSPAYGLEYILPIALDLRRRGVDIVHVQNFSQYIPIIRAFNPGIKIVLHMRCEWLTLLDTQMIDRRLQKADMILGVSEYITETIRACYPHYAQKCATAYTGIDTYEFSPLKSAQGEPGNERRILFVGRITPEKGLHVLLEAFKQVASRMPDVHLDLVGSAVSLPKEQLVGLSDEKQISDLDEFYSGPDYLARLNAILPAGIKERVHFIGNIPHAQTIDFYRRAAILINPALHEPFGRSLIEGNACGTPIIASRAGGMTELIDHGKNGLLIQPGSIEDLTKAMTLLLENDSLRQQMGMTGRQFVVDHFSWENLSTQLLALYEKMMLQ